MYAESKETGLKGLCYHEAFKFLPKVRNEYGSCILIHGSILLKDGKRVGHGWIELLGEGIVWDSLNGFLPKLDFYNALSPEVIETYTPEEAAKLWIKHGHTGPWNSDYVIILK